MICVAVFLPSRLLWRKRQLCRLSRQRLHRHVPQPDNVVSRMIGGEYWSSRKLISSHVRPGWLVDCDVSTARGLLLLNNSYDVRWYNIQWKLGFRPPLFSGQLANTASFEQSRLIFPLAPMYQHSATSFRRPTSLFRITGSCFRPYCNSPSAIRPLDLSHTCTSPPALYIPPFTRIYTV